MTSTRHQDSLRVIRERREEVCARLRFYPGLTVTELAKQGGWGPAWAPEEAYAKRYQQLYCVLRRLLKDGCVVEDVRQGPAYWLSPRLGQGLALAAVQRLEDLLPDWAGLAGVRAEVREVLVRRIVQGGVG